MKSKSQIQTQVFIYVIAVVVSGLILLYGYNAIKNFQCKSKEVEAIQFITGFGNDIKTISLDFGTVRKTSYTIPADYNSVCFVDSETITLRAYQKVPSGQVIIRDSVKDGVLDNVFFIPIFANKCRNEAAKFYSGKIFVSGGFKCVKLSQGKLILRLEGLGDRVNVSEWTEK